MLRKCLRLTILSVLLVAFVAPFALAQSEWQQPKPYPKDAKAFPYTGDRQDLPRAVGRHLPVGRLTPETAGALGLGR